MSLKTLSSQEVRQILKISRRTQDLWLRSGKLRGYRVGRKWIFKEEDIEALLSHSDAQANATKHGSASASNQTDGQKLLRSVGFLDGMSDEEIDRMVEETYKRRTEARYRATG